MPLDPAIRVSDAEREQVVTALAEHHATGRLSLHELDERAGTAYRAVTGADLDRLLADLPLPAPAPAVRREAGAVRDQAWIAWAVTALICVVVWAATSVGHGGAAYFWPVWVIGPWGLAMASARMIAREAADDRPGSRG